MVKIAISAKMRGGKTATCMVLVDKYKYTKLSFASKLKESADEIFGIDSSNEVEKAKNRHIYQAYGQACRKIDPDCWINYVLRYVEAVDEKFDQHKLTRADFCLDDLRFINEALALKQAGFFIVRLEVPREIRAKRGILSSENDISETDLDGWAGFDLVVNDDGTRSPEQIAEFILGELNVKQKA